MHDYSQNETQKDRDIATKGEREGGGGRGDRQTDRDIETKKQRERRKEHVIDEGDREVYNQTLFLHPARRQIRNKQTNKQYRRKLTNATIIHITKIHINHCGESERESGGGGERRPYSHSNHVKAEQH